MAATSTSPGPPSPESASDRRGFLEMTSSGGWRLESDSDRACVVKTDISTVPEPPAAKRWRLAKQVIMLLIITIGNLINGMSLAWTNTLTSDLLIDNTTLFQTELELSPWEMDMMGSLLFAGAVVGFSVTGLVVARWGRRNPMIATCIPGCIGWLFVALAHHHYLVLAGRLLLGFNFGMLGVAVRTYLVEVADTNVRGAASMLPEIMKGAGCIAVICLGMVLPWYHIAFLCAALLLLFCCVIVPFFPESPTFLVTTGREEEAKGVLGWLRGPYGDVDGEIKVVKAKNEESSTSKNSLFKVLAQAGVGRRLLIVFYLFFTANFSGSEVIRANATRMLQESGLPLDREISTMVVMAVVMAGNVTVVFFLDIIGRRRTLVMSLVLVTIAHTAMGTYLYLMGAAGIDIEVLNSNITVTSGHYFVEGGASEMDLSWVPLGCLMLAAFSANMGIGPVPWILSVEYFPTSIRSQVMGVGTAVGNLIAMFSLQSYSVMQEFLTTPGLYWTYAAVAAAGVLFTVACVEETQGQVVG